MVVSVLLSGRDHRSLDGGPWPGERSARSRQARSTAKDGGSRLFCLARNAATSRQGKKAGEAVAGRRSRRSRPSGLIRPFEVAWDAPQNGLMETSMTATIEPAQGHGLTDRAKTHPRVSTKTKACPKDMIAFDFASPRASCCAWRKTARETEREYLSVKLDDPSFASTIWPLRPR
jgi:hypothetical protein